MTDPRQLHAIAREEPAALFRYLVLHDFAWELLPVRVWDMVIRDGRGLLSDRTCDGPCMTLETAAAALRLHGMVAPQYQLSRPLESGV